MPRGKLEALGPGREQRLRGRAAAGPTPSSLFSREGHERLAGVPLAYVRQTHVVTARRLRNLGDNRVGSSHLGCTADATLESETFRVVADHLCSATRGWDVLDLQLTDAQSLFLAYLQERFRDRRVRTQPGGARLSHADGIPCEMASGAIAGRDSALTMCLTLSGLDCPTAGGRVRALAAQRARSMKPSGRRTASRPRIVEVREEGTSTSADYRWSRSSGRNSERDCDEASVHGWS
jgi:hypothetical protein